MLKERLDLTMEDSHGLGLHILQYICAIKLIKYKLLAVYLLSIPRVLLVSQWAVEEIYQALYKNRRQLERNK